MNDRRISRFSGCLLGALIGDVAGAPVEAESSGYICKTFQTVEDILSLEEVEEPLGDSWIVGRYTDDTQMLLALCEWLCHDDPGKGELLLDRFCQAYEPWRRYGPGTARILGAFPENRKNWNMLSRLSFSEGSYGNGAVMRTAPIGLRFYNDFEKLFKTAYLASITTHSHPLAIQGAVLQSVAIAMAIRSDGEFDFKRLCSFFELALDKLGGEDELYKRKFAYIQLGLKEKRPVNQMVNKLGNSIQAYESFPMALYCVLRNLGSFCDAVKDAIFIGGDTDTIACMAGALAGALYGEDSIPKSWLSKVKEEKYTPEKIKNLARTLFEKTIEMD